MGKKEFLEDIRKLVNRSDNRYLTYVTAMDSIYKIKMHLTEIKISLDVHNVIHKHDIVKVDKFKLCVMLVNALETLCKLYVEEQTPPVFDENIIREFSNLYDDVECRNIIEGYIRVHDGDHVFEVMKEILKQNEEN